MKQLGTYFDQVYGILVDRIIRALVMNESTYVVDDLDCFTKNVSSKFMHQPKFTNAGQSMTLNGIVGGRAVVDGSILNQQPMNDQISSSSAANQAMSMKNFLSALKTAQSLSDPNLDPYKTEGLLVSQRVELSRNKTGEVSGISDPYEIPLLVFNSDAEFAMIKASMGDLASKGIIIAISAPMFT